MAGRSLRITLDDARAIVAAQCLPALPDAPAVGRVGLEWETFPIHVDSDGAPRGRVPIEGADGTGAVLSQLAAPASTGSAAPAFTVEEPAACAGGQVTLEPGGQIEHSTRVHGSVARALDDVEACAALLSSVFAAHGIALASCGLDVWHDAAHVPQQLRAARYEAMHAYFARRSSTPSALTPGHVMMVHSCALQVNLDLGPPEVAAERWLVANLVSPLVVATFASSPIAGAVGGRARAWQTLDPTRTGVADVREDPLDALLAAALSADVLLVRRGRSVTSGRRGWTFGDWMREGHPDHGPATVDDFVYHLTTLFPEVRTRGFLELRGIDALPARWRAVPVVLLTGLLYDDAARAKVRAVLEPHAGQLPRLLVRAAGDGVADPELCALAVETWSFALAGASRLPPAYLRPAHLACVEAFLDRFTLRGRCPSDELRELLATSPAAALEWAMEPGGVHVTERG